MTTETDPVSETLCSLVFRIPDDGQSSKVNNSVYYTISSELFKQHGFPWVLIHIYLCVCVCVCVFARVCRETEHTGTAVGNNIAKLKRREEQGKLRAQVTRHARQLLPSSRIML
jgi:hypothetical protein